MVTRHYLDYSRSSHVTVNSPRQIFDLFCSVLLCSALLCSLIKSVFDHLKTLARGQINAYTGSTRGGISESTSVHACSFITHRKIQGLALQIISVSMLTSFASYGHRSHQYFFKLVAAEPPIFPVEYEGLLFVQHLGDILQESIYFCLAYRLCNPLWHSTLV